MPGYSWTLVIAGVQKRNVFADVTSGSKTAVSAWNENGFSSTSRMATLSLRGVGRRAGR
jgi:hypothetical protein